MANTEEYTPPEHVIKPYPGDTGYPLVKGALTRNEWSLSKKKKKKTKLKTYEEFDETNESLLVESQAYFFDDTLDKERVDVQNSAGREDPQATIKWELQISSNKNGVEAFVVSVKSLHIEWKADEDLGMPGEADVAVDKIDVVVGGTLDNLYAESVTYDNKTGDAQVRFGKNKEE